MLRLLLLLRWPLVIILGIGVPAFIYLAFIADEPILEVEYDVDLGQRTVAAIEAEMGQRALPEITLNHAAALPRGR